DAQALHFSRHDALPILARCSHQESNAAAAAVYKERGTLRYTKAAPWNVPADCRHLAAPACIAVAYCVRSWSCWWGFSARHCSARSEEHTSELQSRENLV